MKCPKCGSEMTGGAPHGDWAWQYECRGFNGCGLICTPLNSERRDTDGRDLTELFGLWDETDTLHLLTKRGG